MKNQSIIGFVNPSLWLGLNLTGLAMYGCEAGCADDTAFSNPAFRKSYGLVEPDADMKLIYLDTVKVGETPESGWKSFERSRIGL